MFLTRSKLYFTYLTERFFYACGSKLASLDNQDSFGVCCFGSIFGNKITVKAAQLVPSIKRNFMLRWFEVLRPFDCESCLDPPQTLHFYFLSHFHVKKIRPELHLNTSYAFSPTRPHWAELVIESPCPSVCLWFCLRHRVQFFSRPLIGPQVT